MPIMFYPTRKACVYVADLLWQVVTDSSIYPYVGSSTDLIKIPMFLGETLLDYSPVKY